MNIIVVCFLKDLRDGVFCIEYYICSRIII